MYRYLNGTLTEKTPTWVTVDVNGIGFHVMVPLSTSQKLPAVGERTKLLVHHIVREDAQLLIGFATEEERTLFKLLISVSGIGAKLAVTILSGLGIPDLKRAIVQGSVPTLTSIAGIGRKTAERLVVELREKIVVEAYAEEAKSTDKFRKNDVLIEDSLQALVSLGYSKQSAKTAIQKVLAGGEGSELNPETLIRESLKHI
ncbi:MAG: Holliday junction DNA helicase RuvA [Omnitrophica bacterium RIFCSPLOWO2_12_FULL_50_11]|nr:MAG: Holliday junction DNA helicase RuvA [Omnitrophica bacterium RIFCSPLOWO2_12_FULL_50_11]